jgi:hypothetical protein
MNPPEETTVFRSSKTRWVFVFLGAVGLLIYDIRLLDSPKLIDHIIAFASIGLAGMGVIVAPLILLPNCSFTRTDRNGLTICVFWRTTFYRWADIENFGLVDLPDVHPHGVSRGEPTVGFTLTKAYLARCTPPKMMKFNRRILGFNGVLPDTYGWRAAALAEHLNQLRYQYAGARAE